MLEFFSRVSAEDYVTLKTPPSDNSAAVHNNNNNNNNNVGKLYNTIYK
jgi:hypothetical protein